MSEIAPPVFLPAPLLDYRCNGKGCCCKGWGIPFKPSGLVRLAQALDEPERSARLGWGLKVIVDHEDARLEYFHLDRVDPDDRCRFLEAEGSCEMHRRFGTDALPDLCVNFPSVAYNAGDAIELHWDTICPSVLDVLADPETPYLPQQLDPTARPDLAIRARAPFDRPTLELGTTKLDWTALQHVRSIVLESLLDLERPTIEHIAAISYAFDRLCVSGEPQAFEITYDDPLEPFFDFLDASAAANAPRLLAWRWDRYKRFVWDFDRDHPGLGNLQAFFNGWADPLETFMVPAEPALRPLLTRYLAHRYYSLFVRSQGRLRFTWGSVPHAYALAIRTAAALSGCLDRQTDLAIMKAGLGFADYHYRGLRIPPDALPWFTPLSEPDDPSVDTMEVASHEAVSPEVM
jgi:Fe-S-cluster containining protein